MAQVNDLLVLGKANFLNEITSSQLLRALGGIVVDSSTAESTSLPYFLGIKAFADGGNVVWSSPANAANVIRLSASGTWPISISGLAAKATADANGNTITSTYAKVKAYNDMIHSSNEYTFASPSFSGAIWLNYRTASGATDGNITTYNFGNGKGGTAGVTLVAEKFQGALVGNANTATGFASAKTIALTGNVTGSATGGNGNSGWSIATTVASVPNAALPLRLRAAQSSGFGDANEAIETGFHYMTTTATNRPSFIGNTSNKDYRILTTAYSDQWLQQIATDFRCNEIYYRRRENGTWKSWIEILTSDLILNNTSISASGWTDSTTAKRQLVNHNTLAYWNGAYSDKSSNLTYCIRGAFGTVVTKNYTDSTSASAIGTGTAVPTERDIYYGLPTINNSHAYTSNTTIYAPTTGGLASYVLIAQGETSTPVWKTQASLTAGKAQALTDITTTDKASSSDTWRYVWMSYNNNTTGRPAYDDRFAIQTSTGTLKAPIFSGALKGNADTATSATYLTGQGANVANTRTQAHTQAVVAGGWASADAGYGTTYGTTLDVSGYSTWYHRLAFHTTGQIDYWQGINTNTLTKMGTLLTSSNYTSYINSVRDYNDGKLVKFGYSTSGVAQSAATWIGAWDATVSGEYRLRAVKQADLKVYSAKKWETARTLTIGATGKSIDGTANVSWTPYEMRVTRAQYNVGSNMNQIADHGCELGMANLSGTDTTVNPNGGTSWHHYINVTWSDCADNNSSTSNEWCTQIANKAGTTDLWVRSRSGGSITDGTAWVAPWTRILTGSNWTSVVDGRYVKKTGDSMSGTLSWGGNVSSLNLRTGHASYDGVISYQTSGNEAMLFTTKSAVTSFMFVNGEDTITNMASDRWTKITAPGLQIKNNCVAIGGLITNNTNPSYKLWVNGTGNFSGHLYANNGLTWTNAYWTAPGNIICNANGTNAEFSFDMGAGTQWHVWSTPSSRSILSCWADTSYVQVPVHLYVGSYNNTSYALSTSSFICESWIRTTGSTGWYNESYGGGWYMTDSTYIRAYNGKMVYSSGRYLGDLVPSSWIDGLRYNNGGYNINTYSNDGSYNPWMRATNNHANVAKWFSFGTLGKRFYWIGSTTSRTDNGYDKGMEFNVESGLLYAPIVGGDRIYTGYDSGVTGSVSCSNWFRTNGETGLYNATYGLHLMPNTISTHGGWRISGKREGYHGILIGDAKTAMTIMSIDNEHQGLYTESGTGWIIYNKNNSQLIGLGGATVTGGYKVTTNGSHYITGDLYVAGGNISGADLHGNARGVYSSGYGNGNFTWCQTSGEFAGNSGWASYLVSNHGDGSNYYHQIIAMPFWSVPRYRRLEGGTGTAWFEFITDENYTSKLDGRYVNVTGDTMSGELNMNNNTLSNIGQLTFADPGVGEGISWTGGNGWKIYESPDDLTNAAGNLQFVQNSTRRMTAKTDGTVEVCSRLDAGCLLLTNTSWTGYGTADPDGSLTAVKGRVYFKLI